MIVQESTFEEYSSNALVDVDNVHFIDDSPIQDAMIQHSNPRNMPLRQASYIEYNFTKFWTPVTAVGAPVYTQVG